MSREADLSQCAALAAEAAAVAVRNGGVSIEIKLLCDDGYHLFAHYGTPSEQQVLLAAVPVTGGTQ